MRRLNMLIDTRTVDDEREVAAVLGGEERPVITLSTLVSEFGDLNKALLAQKSPNQMRKWRNPQNPAVLHLTELIGDKALRDISCTDTMRDRTWWRDRVIDESIEVGAANKSIGQVAKMYKEVGKAHQLILPPVFADLTLEGEVDKQRAAFEPDFIENRIVVSGVLDELNDEARDLVYVIADSGMRLSEAANLLPGAIFLDAPVPYVRIKADGRQLKPLHSDREIPLVGLATQALQTHCNTLRPPGRILPELPATRHRTAVDAMNVDSA